MQWSCSCKVICHCRQDTTPGGARADVTRAQSSTTGPEPQNDAHLDAPLPQLAVGAHGAGRDAAHDLGQRGPAALLPAAVPAPQQPAGQRALRRQPGLVLLLTRQ